MDLVNYIFIVLAIFDFTQCLTKTETKLDALVYKLQNCLKNEHVSGNRLVSQEDSSYKRLNYQWQLRGGTRKPLAYFLPESSSDISSAIKCAENLRIMCIPKGGGHSFQKYSYGTNTTDLIIDLRSMNWIGIAHKNRKATVEAGTLLGPLISKLFKNGKFVIPTGSCPLVGISGLTLGGGFGYLSRLMGLTCDYVEEMEVITADGKILQVNKSKYSDLFWALRGGGGSFGVVSKFVFKLAPAPNKMVLWNIHFHKFSFLEIIMIYQKILLSRPPKSIFLEVLYFNSSSLDISFTDASGDPTLIQNYIQLFPTPKSSTKNIYSYYEFAEAEGLLDGNYKHPLKLGKSNEMKPIYLLPNLFFFTIL